MTARGGIQVESERGRFRYWPEVLFLLATTTVGLWASGRWLDPFGDPGFSWSVVYRAAQGESLYRDIFVGYTPLSVDLLAPIERAAGFSARSWLLANWIPAILAGYLLLVAARRHLGALERLAVAAVLIGLSIFAPGSGRLVYPYYPGVVHGLLFGLAALMMIPKDEAWNATRGLCAGALAALAFGCKQEIGIAAFAALSVALLLRPRRGVRWALALSGGALLVLILLAGRIFSAASAASLRELSHLWPLQGSPPSDLSVLFRTAAGVEDSHWMVAVQSAAWWLLWYVGLTLAVTLLWKRVRGARAWIPIAALFLVLGAWWLVGGPSFPSQPRFVALSTLVSFSVFGIALFRPQLPQRAFLMAFGVFAGLTCIRSAFSPFTGGSYDGPGRFAASLAWVLLLCVLLPDLLVTDPASRTLASRLMAAGILLVISPVVVEGARSLRSDTKSGVETRRGTVFVSRANAELLTLLAKILRPSDRVFLVPESNAIDVLFGVRNISPLVDVLPGWLTPRVEGAILEKLERERPDAVILFRRPMPEFGSTEFGRTYGRRLSEWIAQRYETAGSGEGGEVLRRSAASEKPGPGRLR